ncbi:cupin domain-containing protein [Pseudonocardia sp. RS11V-5]|uniref:cupin domain-containing protein n=1 Tax=Pseudonocardia terrae TaxID=2905831 RepID=UPI001E63CCD2|nr:cupin domain-containing protein [Pseudonocardia terrae]MCE3555811.1 cupin domain-containing protein [Pseudonocardia terrae]
MTSAVLWTTAPNPEIDVEEAAPPGVSWHPGPGHTVLAVVDFPPDSVMAQPEFDFASAGAEQMQHLPGLAERFERDNPGMHTTQSVDYALVLQGKVWLDLGDGDPSLLAAGDVVIQQRTRHAWRNQGTDPARVAFVLIGTDRDS